MAAETPKCSKCGGRTAFVSGTFHYDPDQEPYKDGVEEKSIAESGSCYMTAYKCDTCDNIQDFTLDN